MLCIYCKIIQPLNWNHILGIILIPSKSQKGRWTPINKDKDAPDFVDTLALSTQFYTLYIFYITERKIFLHTITVRCNQIVMNNWSGLYVVDGVELNASLSRGFHRDVSLYVGTMSVADVWKQRVFPSTVDCVVWNLRK